MIDRYDWASGREAMIRLGPDTGPVAIVALPLFEEANRTRTFAVTIMRALATRGVVSVLPDLPGTGDSLVATEQAALEDWRTTFAAAAHTTNARYGIAIRSGALLEAAADLRARWQFAPQTGAALVRELERTRGAGDGATDERVIEIAGNRLSRELLRDLAAATPIGPARTLRLASDPLPADRKVDAPPLWRRAEPDNDVQLAQLLAGDITDWISACEG